MAGGAEDVEALLAASENFFGDGKGHHIARIATDLAGIEIGVFVELAAGDCAFDKGPGGALVGVEVAAGKRILARLHVHVDAAGGGEGNQHQERCTGKRCRAVLDWTDECVRPHTSGPASIFRESSKSGHFSWAPPRRSVGTGLPGIGAYRPARTFCR